MTIALESMAVTMPVVKGHPNRAAFRGVLSVVDAPSQRAPSGSGGRRVLLPRGVAEAALPSLLGMALDYAPFFDRHDVRRKVGVITSADIVGRNLEVGGYLYARDFPEIVEEIAKEGLHSARGIGARPASTDLYFTAKSRQEQSPIPKILKDSLTTISGMKSEGPRLRASLAAAVQRLRELTSDMRGRIKVPSAIPLLRAESDGAAGVGLGMSFEVTDVVLADRRARVWTLKQVTFTGAAVLRKSKAAYQDTWIELSG
jgi:hypothetical protein